jgi:hypothetical protein
MTKNFSIVRSIDILSRTPAILRQMLSQIDEFWYSHNEGDETWSPFDVLGHLIHGEKTDWIDRINIILSESEQKTFTPFDRFAQLRDNKGKSLEALLDEFEELRNGNLSVLRDLDLKEEELVKKGIHPSLGEVRLDELLSTWTVHDMSHISQICRVMSHQYKSDVGPWKDYLRILNN